MFRLLGPSKAVELGISEDKLRSQSMAFGAREEPYGERSRILIGVKRPYGEMEAPISIA